jgi:hypothetical protein
MMVRTQQQQEAYTDADTVQQLTLKAIAAIEGR